MPEKLYRLLVVVLLALILSFQAYGRFYKSQNCIDAINSAYQSSITANQILAPLFLQHVNDISSNAGNVNQQIFLSNEHLYEVVTHIFFLEDAALRVQIECK